LSDGVRRFDLLRDHLRRAVTVDRDPQSLITAPSPDEKYSRSVTANWPS
jgi:hypothetical protein